MGLGPAGFGERFLASFCLTCFARFFVRLKKSTTSLHEVLLSLTEKMRAFFLLLHETNSSRASRQVFLRARARIGFWTLALSHTPRR